MPRPPVLRAQPRSGLADRSRPPRPRRLPGFSRPPSRAGEARVGSGPGARTGWRDRAVAAVRPSRDGGGARAPPPRCSAHGRHLAADGASPTIARSPRRHDGQHLPVPAQTARGASDRPILARAQLDCLMRTHDARTTACSTASKTHDRNDRSCGCNRWSAGSEPHTSSRAWRPGRLSAGSPHRQLRGCRFRTRMAQRPSRGRPPRPPRRGRPPRRAPRPRRRSGTRRLEARRSPRAPPLHRQG
mmetsp:Transcript_103748/g.288839  ORF Transcript_103748/g.288839 Transcript_103748/m.288839 type:complete len:244 (+) Transcript_103748:1093-1824(+)